MGRGMGVYSITNDRKIRIMIDKNNNVLAINDYVSYIRPINPVWSPVESMDEFGKIIQIMDIGVFLHIRGGCFFCSDSTSLRLLSVGEALIRKLES